MCSCCPSASPCWSPSRPPKSTSSPADASGSASASAGQAPEFEALGVPFRQRPSRMEEAIHVLRACWTEEPINFAGRYTTIREMSLLPKPVTPGGPPLLFGGFSDPALDRAARLGDGWIAPVQSDVDHLIAFTDKIRAALERHGARGRRLPDPVAAAARNGPRKRPPHPHRRPRRRHHPHRHRHAQLRPRSRRPRRRLPTPHRNRLARNLARAAGLMPQAGERTRLAAWRFPTLKWYRRLMAAGFTDEQARAIVDVARDVYVARSMKPARWPGAAPSRSTPKRSTPERRATNESGTR